MDHLIREAQKRVGTVLRERWTIDGLIGVGGMAAVYKATHRNGNEVAIKILHSDISDSEQIRKRFQREGYVANRVKHRSAVPVFDDDTTEDGCAFLVMELLRGENVEERRERLGGFVPLSEVLGIADQVLDALAAAHGQGIIHRDVKPENLFLTEEGVVKVLDFGIARLQAGPSSNLTVAGAMMGTPGFMSPEQAGGFNDRIDAQTDVWGVGATLFTLLCGEHVHQSASANENVIRSATKPARSIATVLPDLDPGVVALIDKALAFHKRDRWPDARSMQRELRTVANRVLGRARAGSSVALDLELSEPLSTSGVLVDPEGPTRIRELSLGPLPESLPASAVPVSEEPATHRQPTLPPTAALEPSRPSQAPPEPRGRVSTGRPVEAPSVLPVPRAIAIAVAGTILVLAVLFAVAVGTIMRQRMSAAPEPSASLAAPPVVDLAPELDSASSSSPALDTAAPDAAAASDAGVVTDAATPSDASSPDADADAAPKPPVKRRWYRKKRRTSPTPK